MQSEEDRRKNQVLIDLSASFIPGKRPVRSTHPVRLNLRRQALPNPRKASQLVAAPNEALCTTRSRDTIVKAITGRRKSVQSCDTSTLVDYIKRLIRAEDGVARVCSKYLRDRNREDDSRLFQHSEYQNQLISYYRNVHAAKGRREQTAAFVWRKAGLLAPPLAPSCFSFDIPCVKTSYTATTGEGSRRPFPGRKKEAASMRMTQSLLSSPRMPEGAYENSSEPQGESEKCSSGAAATMAADERARRRQVILLSKHRKCSQDSLASQDACNISRDHIDSPLENRGSTAVRGTTKRQPQEITLNFRIFSPYHSAAAPLVMEGRAVGCGIQKGIMLKTAKAGPNAARWCSASKRPTTKPGLTIGRRGSATSKSIF